MKKAFILIAAMLLGAGIAGAQDINSRILDNGGSGKYKAIMLTHPTESLFW